MNNIFLDSIHLENYTLSYCHKISWIFMYKFVDHVSRHILNHVQGKIHFCSTGTKEGDWQAIKGIEYI